MDARSTPDCSTSATWDSVRITGEGVEAALEALLPADITGPSVHKARYSLLLDEGGGILDDLMLTRRG